jgi:methyltransferase (TIGR00027 family)
MSSPDTMSTAEAASRWRALQTLHLDPPAFVDDWAVHLLPGGEREALRGDEGRAEFLSNTRGWAMSGVGVGSLLFAEDVVLAAVESGIDQYVILGAGFDTFAMRHPELAGRLAIFEVDHPDVQRLKRQRLGAAPAVPVLPHFVPVDFEVTLLSEQLLASPYDATRPAVVSWLNTLPYLTPAAIESTLAELADLTAPGSILVCNYPCKGVPISDEQMAVLRSNSANVAARGEPFQSRFTPDEFVSLLAQHEFVVEQHLTDLDLNARYYANRTDGFRAGVPARIITARR